ncbi:GFA family protein [Hyphomonas johnsonii]|uniref:Putative GFA family protein n=1 Tax=Hyphomonas johnsonii MHS-2 TaxID=1280950 RepID=A0A059FTQ6_9PROT|nr:GFA family protein [Hyphomonas johnsonii]KCZ94055.1 putative GFA family protein [Hyphomonas johnsonii MHS-2]
MTDEFQACEGGCTCGHVRYKVVSKPMIVHCCHCRWCQRQTGSAFAVNALIEADRVQLVQGEVEELTVGSPSGKGQIIARCPRCRIAVWSNYHMSGLRERIRFIRVGTLDNPDLMPPDVHIFTTAKQPWVQIPESDRRVDIYYDYEETWSPDSLDRRAALFDAAGIAMR